MNNLSNTLSNLLTSTNSNIHLVSYRSKITNNIEDKKIKCISFGVSVKKPLSALSEDEKIPKTITIDGVEYKTDVIEIKMATPLIYKIKDSINPDTPVQPVSFPGGQSNLPYFFWVYGLDSYMMATTWWPWSEHKSVQRPIRGGLQITGTGSFNYGYGTLGGVVEDLTDHTAVGITNLHVANTLSGTNVMHTQYSSMQILSGCGDMNRDDRLIYSPYSPNDKTYPNVYWPYIFYPYQKYCPFDMVGGYYLNQGIETPWNGDWMQTNSRDIYWFNMNGIAPLTYDPQGYKPSLDSNMDLGFVKRYMPFIPQNVGLNQIDAALITLKSPTNTANLPMPLLSAGYSHTQACFKDKSICNFATTQEIDSLVTNNVPLFKSGARTSATGWPNPLSGDHRFDKNLCISMYGIKTSADDVFFGSAGDMDDIIPYTWGFDSSHSLVAVDVNASLTVGYGFGELDFQNQIVFYNPVYAGGGGDSGSLLYGLFNANNPSLSAFKIVGLVFAGAAASWAGECPYMMANRIDNVANLLSISAYNSLHTNLTDLTKLKKKYVPGKSSQAFIIGEDGKKYWQTGFTTTLPS